MRYLNLSFWLILTNPLLSQNEAPASWPQFRGPQGRAIAEDDKRYPMEFGPGKNELWKIALPSGLSSPCIWGDCIFVTGYDAANKRLETIGIDRQKGKVLWRRMAPAEKIESVYKVNSPAAATPACDGKRVVVAFGSYGLLCYDLNGKELWKRPLPTPPTGFGSATSPIIVGDRVLINGQGKDLHVLAIEADTGKTVWTTEGTPFPSIFPVPHLWNVENTTEVIVAGRGGLLAYDLKDGGKRWWVPGLSPEANTSATQGDGLLFVASHLPGGDPDLRMKLPPFDDLVKKHDKDGDDKIGRAEVPTDLVIFVRGGKEGVGEIHLH